MPLIRVGEYIWSKDTYFMALSLNKQQDDWIMVGAGSGLTCEEWVGGFEADACASIGVEAHQEGGAGGDDDGGSEEGATAHLEPLAVPVIELQESGSD